ncbi:hypothetical protein BAUCODRAFT_63637, partial [Baudoinia panamericana UAMH 10762]
PLVNSPFYIDYGINVHVAPSAFVHRNVYFGDSPHPDCPIVVNEGVFIGPNCQILTIAHDMDWRHRHGPFGPCWTAPVVIGEDCHVGAGCTIMPGVTIGYCAVVEAGSIVTNDIPLYHVAEGNLARMVKKVAADTATAPDLLYKRRGMEVMVVQPGNRAAEMSAALINSAPQEPIPSPP